VIRECVGSLSWLHEFLFIQQCKDYINFMWDHFEYLLFMIAFLLSLVSLLSSSTHESRGLSLKCFEKTEYVESCVVFF